MLGDIIENYMRSGRYDSKGREIGYIVGLRDDGVNFYAWVQNSRRVSGGEWEVIGLRQRSKSFKSRAFATGWAYATANERIAKLKV